jgi:hypothetical protein
LGVGKSLERSRPVEMDLEPKYADVKDQLVPQHYLKTWRRIFLER